MKKIIVFVLVALCLYVGAAYAAEDSDFVGEWTLKKIFFGEYGFEVNASDFGMDDKITLTEDHKFINIDENGEVTEAEWTRKLDDTITVTSEAGESMDFVLEDNMLIMSVEDENGNITRMKFAKPGTTCNCEELQKRIEELEAELETLKAADK